MYVKDEDLSKNLKFAKKSKGQIKKYYVGYSRYPAQCTIDITYVTSYTDMLELVLSLEISGMLL